MKNLDVILVAGLVHYSPLYIAGRLLRSAGPRHPSSVRFIEVGSDAQAVQEASRRREDPDSIPLLITGISDIGIHQHGSPGKMPEGYVLWFILVERPFFALACDNDRYDEIYNQINEVTGSLRLACYREGSTIRYLVENAMRAHVEKGAVTFVDVEFPRDGFDLVRNGEADLAVTIRPWLFSQATDSPLGRLVWDIPTRPFGFTCGLTHRKYFEQEESRSILEHLTARVSEAVYLLYSSYDPYWQADRITAWTPESEGCDPHSFLEASALVDTVNSLTFMKVLEGGAEAGRPPQFSVEELGQALRWMASTQIWSFDSLELPRIEQSPVPTGLVTAKELAAAEREAGRIYEEVKPTLLKLSGARQTLQHITANLEYIENRLDPARWNPGAKELQIIGAILERECFADFHTPEYLEFDQLFVLQRTILQRIQSRDFFDAEATFREECAKGGNRLPESFWRSCFGPFHVTPGPDDPRTPYDRAVELVYFAKALSQGKVPALWLTQILDNHSGQIVGEASSLWRAYFDCGGHSDQVRLLRGLHGLLSEVALDSSGPQLVPGEHGNKSLSLKCFVEPKAEAGMAGLVRLNSAIKGIQESSLSKWQKEHADVRTGRTLHAIGSLAELQVKLKGSIVPDEGLTIEIEIPLFFRSAPRISERA